MKKKNKVYSVEEPIKIPSKEYTIDELIELGEKNNTIQLAPPLFEADIPKEKDN